MNTHHRSIYRVIIVRRTILPESVETTQYWTRSVASHHTTAEGLPTRSPDKHTPQINIRGDNSKEDNLAGERGDHAVLDEVRPLPPHHLRGTAPHAVLITSHHRSIHGMIIARRTILPESMETTQYWTRSVPSHHTTAEGLPHTQS
jgi:hypothetical protein